MKPDELLAALRAIDENTPPGVNLLVVYLIGLLDRSTAALESMAKSLEKLE